MLTTQAPDSMPGTWRARKAARLSPGCRSTGTLVWPSTVTGWGVTTRRPAAGNTSATMPSTSATAPISCTFRSIDTPLPNAGPGRQVAHAVEPTHAQGVGAVQHPWLKVDKKPRARMTRQGLRAVVHEHQVAVLRRLGALGQLARRRGQGQGLRTRLQWPWALACKRSDQAEHFALHQQHEVRAIHAPDVVRQTDKAIEIGAHHCRHQKIPGR